MATKYKAVLSDFDNTMVGTDHMVSERVRNKIRELTDNGIIFSLATGRAFPGIILQTCKNLELKTPQITWGGAYIMDPVTEKPIWKETIPDETSAQILEALSKKQLYTIVELFDYCYTSDGNPLSSLSSGIPVKHISELPIKDIAKIIVSALRNDLTESNTRELTKDLMQRFPDLSVIPYKNIACGRWGFDMTSEKATKHTAVLEFMEIMKLKPEEVIGIGDGYNDYPLLTACGLKIAMEDAPAEVKDIADFIAPPQKKDGLLVALNRYFP